ncbi:MAG: DUF1592 domain-containing protein [Verrucomicrobiaceae bacterium]|nr:DUF1592 domain-containing protein [Verrucomicrobiaceae bacterium]
MSPRTLRSWPLSALLAALSFVTVPGAPAAPDWKAAQKVLDAKCYECHNEKKTKGDIDLKKFAGDPQFVKQFDVWLKVKDTIDNGDMPPPKAHQMTEQEHTALIGWVNAELDTLAAKQAGDPGQVTMRRLTNAEYDYTIRDLTGQDFGFGKEFTTDGGGGEGFSNTGDVLFVSPAQLDKYFAAARKIADQASILPGTGVQFQTARVGLRGAEQMKSQSEQSLYIWYQKKAAPLLPKDDDDLREADYMLACWKWKHKDKTSAQSLEALAKEMKLNVAFLNNWWNFLTNNKTESRFLDLTRVPWNNLPPPDAAKSKEVPAAVTTSLAANAAQRNSWYHKPKGAYGSVQRSQQDADALRSYHVQSKTEAGKPLHLCIGDDGDGSKGDIALVSEITINMPKGKKKYQDALNDQIKKDREALTKPGAKVEELNKRIAACEATLARFGKHPLGKQIKGDTLAIAAPLVMDLPVPEGGSYMEAKCKLDIETPDVDVATIQWKLTADTPPDVTKIMPGVLTIWKTRTTASHKTMSDFGRMKEVFPDEYDRRLEEVARNYYRSGKGGSGVYYYSDEQLGAELSEWDREYLRRMKVDWGYTASAGKLNPQQWKEWDQMVVGHLHWFAGRAWRRPLEQADKDKLAKLYEAGVKEGLDRESAARQVIVRVLVSPNFLFKAETLPVVAGGAAEIALGPWELASRLSYFLWASLPDQQLEKVAADGSIMKKEVLAAQVKRMLSDPRAEAMAREFAGQWLEFNTFGGHIGVDLAKYPQFTDDLRRDMHREIITFFSKLVREDRSVDDILGAKYTFLNERLAKYYGVPGVTGDEMRQVDVSAQKRGGLLGMGAMLTKTSRPNRTSPVVRGNYLYQVVLGISAPPPPPNVPKLPAGVEKPKNMREMLVKHRTDKACAVCHERIDPMGFALETFDPIGRFRAKDEQGDAIEDSATTKDGTLIAGLNGLRTFLQNQDDQFKTQVCRKLLGYALGRQTMPSDKPLIADMKAALKDNSGKFSAAVLKVVTSRQFLNRRVDKNVASN